MVRRRTRRPAPASRKARASALTRFYQAGKVQYDDKNYDAAIVQFREAYKRDCSKHDLLRNRILARLRAAREPSRGRCARSRCTSSASRIRGHRHAQDRYPRTFRRQIAAAPPPTATATAPVRPARPRRPSRRASHTIAVAGRRARRREHRDGRNLPRGRAGRAGELRYEEGKLHLDGPHRRTSPSDQKQAAPPSARHRQPDAIIAGAGVLGAGLLWHFLGAHRPCGRRPGRSAAARPAGRGPATRACRSAARSERRERAARWRQRAICRRDAPRAVTASDLARRGRRDRTRYTRRASTSR